MNISFRCDHSSETVQKSEKVKQDWTRLSEQATVTPKFEFHRFPAQFSFGNPNNGFIWCVLFFSACRAVLVYLCILFAPEVMIWKFLLIFASSCSKTWVLFSVLCQCRDDTFLKIKTHRLDLFCDRLAELCNPAVSEAFFKSCMNVRVCVQVGATPPPAAPSGTQKIRSATWAQEAAPAWSCWRVSDDDEDLKTPQTTLKCCCLMLKLDADCVSLVSSGKVLPGVDALSSV